MAADVVKLLKDIIAADSVIGPRVTHIVATVPRIAVYEEALPAAPLMDLNFNNRPATAVVVVTFPGRRDPDVPFWTRRIITRCYGPTQQHAKNLDILVQDLLSDETFDVGDPGDPGRVRMAVQFSSGPVVDIDASKFPYTDSIYEVNTI